MAVKSGYINYIKQAEVSTDYPLAFNFKLIDNLEDLRNVLMQQTDAISFDTETTGLNADTDRLVGYSFCLDGKTAYYVPVDHADSSVNDIEISKEEYDSLLEDSDIIKHIVIDELKVTHYYKGKRVKNGLGKSAVDLIYLKMLKTPTVLMFNMRFDTRIMEQYGFIQLGIDAKEKDLHSYCYYDMSKLNTIDVQMLVFLADTNVPYPSLKKSEEYYLGWRGATFSETLGDVENFYYLDPKKAYMYAATDALGTYLLGFKLLWVYQESKRSGNFDIYSLYPLLTMENEYTEIDTELLSTYSEYYHKEMNKVETELYNIAGKPFNITSPKQKSDIFKSLDIDTGELNKRDEMKGGKAILEATLSKYPEGDPRRSLMEGIIKYGNLKKQQTSYVDNTLKMCENSLYKNHLRFNYKTTTVPTGRLAAGGDSKNKYFSELNIQNIPKPHSCMYYYIDYKNCPEDIKEKINNERQEYRDDGLYIYRLLDWVFKTTPWEIEGVEEFEIEGFKQDATNIRSTFVPDEGRYWCSMDFSGEELRLATLFSKEPVWLDAFKHGKDLHYATAESIFGVGNVNKDRRKLAKQTNFSVLYGATARRIQTLMKGTLEEAEEFLKNYKSSLPTLFKWIAQKEHEGESGGTNRNYPGTIYSYFGRPRRVKYYFNSNNDMKTRSFGLRTCVNSVIQSTGADVLKYSLIKLYKALYRDKNKDEVRKHIKFINTVHDEINFNIRKEDLNIYVPIVISCMILQEPTWEFPLIVGFDIGTRWGNCIEFDYDMTDYHIIGPAGKPYKKEEKKESQKVEEVKENKIEDTKSNIDVLRDLLGEENIY